MANRKSTGIRARFEAFKRDGFSCQYCGRTPPDIVLEVDHIIPVSKGGDNSEGNLITSCRDCNRGKSNVPLSSVPDSIHSRMAEAKEKRKQIDAYHRFLIQDRKRLDQDIQDIGVFWYNLFKQEKDAFCFGLGRTPTIKTFLKSLNKYEIMDAMEISVSRIGASEESDYKAFKYFCGICWRKIKG